MEKAETFVGAKAAAPRPVTAARTKVKGRGFMGVSIEDELTSC
jgi:hypothetical protein